MIITSVKCLEEDIDELLNFYRCPKEFSKHLRTTNAIERVFREVRRRTRTMICFQNRDSLERIIYAIFYRMNKKYSNNLNIMEDTQFLRNYTKLLTLPKISYQSYRYIPVCVPA
ncbi:MAG: transposase [Elusimicrobiota bacterium]